MIYFSSPVSDAHACTETCYYNSMLCTAVNISPTQHNISHRLEIQISMLIPRKGISLAAYPVHKYNSKTHTLFLLYVRGNRTTYINSRKLFFRSVSSVYSLDCCNLNLFYSLCEYMGHGLLPAYQRALEVDFPTYMRKAILGVFLTCAPMEVLFRQLVLIPLSLQAPVGQTGRRKR